MPKNDISLQFTDQRKEYNRVRTDIHHKKQTKMEIHSRQCKNTWHLKKMPYKDMQNKEIDR